ncbi:MAG TPA: hypothetical protein VLX92_06740 [Kofleriaceae bacterium]|nr:hypothetical protein [Kofleriaceae bacterium]
MTEGKRRWRRRALWLACVAAAIALAVLYLRCGRGWGTGGGGGTGAGPASAPPAYCELRMDAAGLTSGGTPIARGDAVALCRERGAAHLVITGDAREGDVRALEAALDAAHVATSVSDPSHR